METINTLCICVQGIISAGLVMRIIFCAIKLTHEEDEAPRYKKRIRNCVVMAIIAQLIFPIKEMLTYYFGSGY